MRDGTRAVRSAALLAGFWIAAWLQVAAAAAGVLLILALLPGAVALRVGAPLCIATTGLLGFATAQALRVRRTVPAGVPVSRTDATALWALVDGAAAAARVKPPDAVIVVADARVWLSEHFRVLGLFGGRRELHLGLPLLQAWDVAWVGAVVAHELAHGSAELGRFAPVAYRGRLALRRIVPRIPQRSPVAPLLQAWAGWFRRVDAPLARAREEAADRVAVSFAGAQAAAAVLRDGPALEGLQRLFHAEYVSPGWQAGYVPDDVFGGFLRVLAARADEMARLRTLAPPAAGEWDAHPPLADRLAALAGSASARELLADGATAPETAGTAAAELVPDLPGLGRALQAVAFPAAGRTVVRWDEFFSVARNAELEREAHAALTAIARAADTPVSGLADVLDLVADGRLPKAAEIVFGGLPHAEATERITDLITLMLALCALDGGVARWRHSWTGTAELVAIDGTHLDLGEPASLASDPSTVEWARRRLAELGIDPAATALAAGRRPARVPVLGGVLHVLVDDARTDLLVIETGFVLLRSLPRFRGGDARRRLNELAIGGVRADGSRADDGPDAGDRSVEAVVPGVQAAPGAGSRFVPFADVVGVPVPQGRRRWALTLSDGSAVSIRGVLESDELQGGWAAVDEAMAFLARTRTDASGTATSVPAPAFAPGPVPSSGAEPQPASASPAASVVAHPATAFSAQSAAAAFSASAPVSGTS